jgi:hypothetical protein
MLNPTDAAALVLMLFAATVSVLFKITVGRRGSRPGRLHVVQGVDSDGLCRAVAIYANSEAEAVRRARRIAPSYQDLTASAYRD